MPFPIISPAFYKELVDGVTLKPEDTDYCDVFVSAAAVEYVMYMSERSVVKKLMETEEPLAFIMANLNENDEKNVIPVSLDIVKENPIAEHYWRIRVLIMNILQNKGIAFEKRMLLLNYALKIINGMSVSNLSGGIPDFISGFMETANYDDTLKYFEGVRPAVKFSLADGISLLKSLAVKAPRGFGAVMDVIYRNLKTTPDTLKTTDVSAYGEMRRAFGEEYLVKKPHYIENIMVNYVWTYSIPFAYSSKLSIWDNYVFFCSIYNALKVLIACYMPGKSDDDFADAVAAFDGALRGAGSGIAVGLVDAVKNVGQDNNGDLAVLVIS
jgi:hypothetical protein